VGSEGCALKVDTPSRASKHSRHQTLESVLHVACTFERDCECCRGLWWQRRRILIVWFASVCEAGGVAVCEY